VRINSSIILFCFLLFSCDGGNSHLGPGQSSNSINAENLSPTNGNNQTPKPIEPIDCETVNLALVDNQGTKYRLSVDDIFTGDVNPKKNYAYSDYSGSPIIGPNPERKTIKFFLYQYSGDSRYPAGLYFYSLQNEKSTHARTQLKSSFRIQTTGNQKRDFIVVSDDPNDRNERNCPDRGQRICPELRVLSSDLASIYYGWDSSVPDHKTDGFVIGPFKDNTFEIINDINFIQGYERIEFWGGQTTPIFTLKEGDSFSIKNIKKDGC
jgi:hypothetical protein